MKIILAFIVSIAPELAHAHAGAGEGFLRGLQHPLGGIDHVLLLLILGMLTVRTGRPLAASAVIVGLSALLHDVSGWAYGAGFVIATALLLALGIAFALIIKKRVATS